MTVLFRTRSAKRLVIVVTRVFVCIRRIPGVVVAIVLARLRRCEMNSRKTQKSTCFCSRNIPTTTDRTATGFANLNPRRITEIICNTYMQWNIRHVYTRSVSKTRRFPTDRKVLIKRSSHAQFATQRFLFFFQTV